MDGITTRTTIGGTVTLLATATATILFLSQMFLYCQVDVTHSLDLAPSFPLNSVISSNHGISRESLNARSYPGKKKSKKNRLLLQEMKTLAANRLDVSVHITFPNMHCKNIDYSQNGAKFSTGDFTKQSTTLFTKRKPSEYDYAEATGQSTDNKSKKKQTTETDDACTIRGTITVARLGGDLAFFMSEVAFRSVGKMLEKGLTLSETDQHTGGHDVSHYIHEITFGDHFPLSTNPLKDTMVRMEDPTGVGLHQMSIKLVPTKYKKFMQKAKEHFQLSASAYVLSPQRLVGKLPGLSLHYDLNPVAVHHVESRENFFVFLSSLVGIVGGVFVTVGLVSGAVIQSAQAVIKKQDWFNAWVMSDENDADFILFQHVL